MCQLPCYELHKIVFSLCRVKAVRCENTGRVSREVYTRRWICFDRGQIDFVDCTSKKCDFAVMSSSRTRNIGVDAEKSWVFNKILRAEENHRIA